MVSEQNADAEHVDGGSWHILTALVATLAAVATLVALAGNRMQSGSATSMIRIANDTGVPLQQVRNNDILFGNVPADGVSHYQPVTPAYRYASLRLIGAGEKFESIPDDFLGETPLGERHFTYRINRNEVNGKPYFDIRVQQHSSQ